MTMYKSFIVALTIGAAAMSGGVAQAAQAQPRSQAGTHLMWVYPFKSNPYAARHDNKTCPNMPSNARG